MNLLALDTEGPIFDKKELWRGNHYGDPRPLVCYSFATNTQSAALKWMPFAQNEIQDLINEPDMIVGANFKHDVGVLRKVGVDFFGVKIWDVQLAEFLLSRQTHKFPSLDSICEKYGIPKKLDLVKEEFWDNKCSCHVSIVERLNSIMRSNSVLNAIAESMNGQIEIDDLLTSEPGGSIIQISMKLLKESIVQNLLLILSQRLTHTKSQNAISTESAMLNTISLWHAKAVKCVENLRNLSVSTTATEREELEVCCADTVMQLLGILKNQSGWHKHHPTCQGSPIETEDVPWPILSEYAEHDAVVTLAAAKKQMEEMNPKMATLCRLMGQDLLILQEMEHNGITFDEELCKKKSIELDHEISEITAKLANVYPHIPINFGSGDQLSAFLYGGTIVEETKEHVGFFKTGAKAGEPKYKNVEIEHHLPRLFEPVKGSELKKEGFYETNEGVLKKLKGPHKKLVDLLLRLAKLDKLRGTYYDGLIKLNEEMHWPKGKLHGQLNQTLARTGRLSSSKPNQQNFASELLDIFISDYD